MCNQREAFRHPLLFSRYRQRRYTAARQPRLWDLALQGCTQTKRIKLDLTKKTACKKIMDIRKIKKLIESCLTNFRRRERTLEIHEGRVIPCGFFAPPLSSQRHALCQPHGYRSIAGLPCVTRSTGKNPGSSVDHGSQACMRPRAITH